MDRYDHLHSILKLCVEKITVTKEQHITVRAPVELAQTFDDAFRTTFSKEHEALEELTDLRARLKEVDEISKTSTSEMEPSRGKVIPWAPEDFFRSSASAAVLDAEEKQLDDELLKMEAEVDAQRHTLRDTQMHLVSQQAMIKELQDFEFLEETKRLSSDPIKNMVDTVVKMATE